MDTNPQGWYVPFMRAEEILETLTDDELREKADACFIQAENMARWVNLPINAAERQRLLAEADFYLKALAWRSDARTAHRDFWMEVAVIGLIGVEIILSLVFGFVAIHEARDQARIFAHMDTSTDATAKTLTSLKSAVEAMNATLQMQLDAARKSEAEAERSAKAGEASASTASQALRVSERAYVHVEAGNTSIPKVGEKLGFKAYFENSGRTPALDVVTTVVSTIAPASETPEHIRSRPHEATGQHSKGVIPAGGKVQTIWQSVVPLSQGELDGLTSQQTRWYVIADVRYKDEFNQPHQTNFCGFLDLTTNTLLRCGSLNDAN